jgi:hypothetical protein
METTTVKQQRPRHVDAARDLARRRSRSRVDHDAYYRAERDADPYREVGPAA